MVPGAYVTLTGRATAADPTYIEGEAGYSSFDLKGAMRVTGAGSGGAIVITGNPVTYTDRSGTVTSGGVAQVLMALNASRGGFILQNNSTGDLWFSSTATAVAAQPSIWLPAGSYYEPPSTGVPTAAISIFGATTGQAFSAREW